MGIRKRLKQSRVAGLLPPAPDEGDIRAANCSGNNTLLVGGTEGNLRAVCLGGRTGSITLKDGSAGGSTLFVYFHRSKDYKGIITMPGNGIPFQNGVFIQYQNSSGVETGDSAIFYEVDED